MNPLRSVGARLALALAVVVAAALALVDLAVVPSLERNLINAKQAQLRGALSGVAEQVGSIVDNPYLSSDVQAASISSNARVAILTLLDDQNVIPYEDSNLVRSNDLSDDPIALRAARLLEPASGTVTRGSQRFAEAALPVGDSFVILLSASLHDSLANIALVRHRLLIAGLIALVASLLVGYVAATVFARRIRRLERAADRIAGGDFSEPVADRGSDEVGQLARAFERMRQRLAQLERARREFIANASHELRTPLFSLGGFLELMAEEDLDAETQAEFLATMREQIDRLTKLATDLLDLSRLDAGRMHVESEAIDLGMLAQTLAEEFRAVARAGGHVLTLEAGEGIGALGDEERTLQIGRILIENALVHTPDGTTIRIRARSGPEAARLEIEDEGPGIPAEHAEHVFDRFYRLDGSRASGSGLGLAIARELAELMGGLITLESTQGRTRFVLQLAPAPAEAGQNGRPVPRENADPVTEGGVGR